MQQSLDKLLKIIRLEAERGFDNRAVVGGLDKFKNPWVAEARQDDLPDALIQSIIQHLTNYPDKDADERAISLKELWNTIQSNKGGTGTAFPDSDTFSRRQRQQPSTDTNKRPPSKQRERSPARADGTRAPSRTRPPVVQINESDSVGLNAPLTVLPGIGTRNAETLSILGLNTLGDMLYYFPRRYDDYSHLKPINHLFFGEEVTVLGTIQSIVTRPTRGGKMHIVEAVVSDGTGAIRVNWFNQPWLVSKLRPGTAISLSGRIEQYLGRIVLNSPDWEPLEQEQLHTNRIVPVYPLTARVTQKVLRRLMHQVITYWAPRVTDYLPDSTRLDADLIDLQTALIQVHFPDSVEKLRIARQRLAFDEIFLMQLGVMRQKFVWQSSTARVFEVSDEWLTGQVARLPFPLTQAQHHAINDMRTDFLAGRPMNRLLQGDVGSGKTIVAALAVLMVTQHGAQAAVMAPTSILAEQHYHSLTKLLATPAQENDVPPLRAEEIRLLVGDTSENEKEEIRNGLADGTIKIIIGTHALLEAPVIFKQLQMAVIDEQHRFGVEQRATLRSKGENPHLLVMTATPIPRSLALTVYGDLDLSVMDEMPAGRQIIETHVLFSGERERAYTLIRAQVLQEHHQAFIIYPLIEQGENTETKAAVEEYERLQREVFPKLRLGLLHGRLKPEEKDRVMSQFRDGDYDILVSTSVVEVGVDIPNATVMLIEGANHFGLSQLHQFRGRVGRGEAKSFCLLIPDTDDHVENERLTVMAETNDGFVLAERDLQQRGPGEFLGTRQSGYTELKLAQITDVQLIEKARLQAQQLFTQDPMLEAESNQLLVKNLDRFWGGGKGEAS